MKSLIIFVFLALLIFEARASEVIMVQRDFPMKNKSPEVPADVYIDEYFKIGEILAVARKVTIEKSERIQKIDSINIPYCLIKIIYSEGSTSVGRVVYIKNLDELPNIKIYSPIIGDLIQKPTEYLLKGYKTSQIPIISQEEYASVKPNLDPKQKAQEETFQILL